jgi:hypothetical protein
LQLDFGIHESGRGPLDGVTGPFVPAGHLSAGTLKRGHWWP